MQKKWSILMVMSVLGCGEKSTDTGTSTDTSATTTETGDTGETSVPLIDNPCEGVTDSLEVLYSGRGGLNEPTGTDGLTITTQEEWDVFAQEFWFGRTSDSFSRDTFDWSTEQVLVGTAYESSTCGLSILAADACTVNESAILHMQVEDSSGGCDAICDAEGQMVHVVVAPSASTPEYSVHITNACQ